MILHVFEMMQIANYNFAQAILPQAERGSGGVLDPSSRDGDQITITSNFYPTQLGPWRTYFSILMRQKILNRLTSPKAM